MWATVGQVRSVKVQCLNHCTTNLYFHNEAIIVYLDRLVTLRVLSLHSPGGATVFMTSSKLNVSTTRIERMNALVW